ncbi:MAG: VWA domain-containing protein [Planctomycetota bacterium]|nr:VWA domain-containing protein [Planctomycetota bacterium]
MLCVSVGCGLGKTPAASPAITPPEVGATVSQVSLSPPPSASAQASLSPSPSASAAGEQQYTYRLPGMECLVNEFGIRRKVIVTRRGLRCTDRAPGGTVTGPELKFFMPYFVFDAVPPKGNIEYFQIGLTPRKSSVLGWVAATNAAAWDTRVAARYLRNETVRVPPLLVFDSDKACEELIKTGSTGEKPIARASLRADRSWMPWPIAETRTFTFGGRAHEFVRLEFLGANSGNFDAPGRAGDARPVYSEGEVAKIKDNVKMLDVVFCVDLTHSMQSNIDAMVAAVELIVRGLKDLPFRPDVNFGLVLYRDYVRAIAFEENGKPSAVKVYPLHSDVNAFLELIRPLKEAEAGSEDLPEAVYDGVQAALTRTDWRGQGLSNRAMVLIGDNSAHEPGSRKNPKNISADDLIKTARSRQTNVRIFSLCIEGAGEPEERVLHKAQFTRLAEESGGKCFSLDEADRVIEQIRNIMETETALVHRRSVVVDALAAGKTSEQIITERQASGREVTEVMEFLQGAGVEVARLRPGVPAFATGWCLAEADGVPLLGKEVYVARPEIDRLLSELNELCVHLAPDFAKQAFQVGLGSRLANPLSFFAEHRPEPMDVYLMAKGVPCSQGLLRLTRAEIEHMPEEQRAVLREKIARQVVPQLTNARNNNEYFTWLNDLEFGWIPESLLP